MRLPVGALGGQDKVQGVRQGAQGAAPSLASLEPPWSSEVREKAGTFALCFWVSYITIVCLSVAVTAGEGDGWWVVGDWGWRLGVGSGGGGGHATRFSCSNGVLAGKDF